jgi:hypothetical protein
MRTLLVLTAVLAAATPAAADAQFAVVVGANEGGAGQATLKFAEDDAHRVAEVLRELGGYDAADITIVVKPDPAKVLAAIDAIGAKAAAAREAGTPATVFFYYSGHAKASALNLGDQELALGTLRDKLLGLPSALTVVVLDACQSGAFSRVKGAEPAADFSFNSKSRLDATGVAVLASSTGSELSQESDVLGSSYFTHHLLVGLRGAADGSKDGRVTIDEAYRYAYHQTLLATAETAIGSQHVSLEVDLKGHGEVPLSYPAQATAQLELPASLAGDILVERTAAKAVLAELHKVAGEAVRVALAPGDYDVLVRRDKQAMSCPVVLRDGGVATIDLARCEKVKLASTVAKGATIDDAILLDGRRLAVDVTFGVGVEMDDAYTQNLRDFGYRRKLIELVPHLQLAARYRMTKNLQAGGSFGITGSPTWVKEDTDATLEFTWTTVSVVGFVRADRALFWPRLRPFVQAGLGIGLGSTELVDEMDVTHEDSHTGVVLTGSAGFEVNRIIGSGFGLAGQYTFTFSPVITNLIGDRHLGLGHYLELAAHYRF